MNPYDKDSPIGSKRKRRMSMSYSDDQHSTGTHAVPFGVEVQRNLQGLERAFESASSLDEGAIYKCKQLLHWIGENCKTGELLERLFSEPKWMRMFLSWLKLSEQAAKTENSHLEELLREVCFVISQLASTPNFHNINQADTVNVLQHIIDVIRNVPLGDPLGTKPTWSSLARRACEAITSISHDNKAVKKLVHELNGIPALVRMLGSHDSKVQRAGASVLRTLAFKEEANKMAIVEADALPKLIEMLKSEEHQTHFEAVGTLGNLVHSSQEIKQEVLKHGALQAVINLLNCSCRDSQREAALLVGQFAQYDSQRRGRDRRTADAEDYRIKIVQRGAVPPLIMMLRAQDRPLREMAAFALGRLAQNVDNQAGIFAMGALPPLLELLQSKVKNLEHNAAFALYGLADNVDNAPEIVKQGGYQELRELDFPDGQPTKDCINKTLRRLGERVDQHQPNKEHLMNLLRSKQPGMKQRMATALVHLLKPEDLGRAYVEYGGLSVLLDMICGDQGASQGLAAPICPKQQQRAAEALAKLATYCRAIEQGNSSSFIPSEPDKQVFIGASYVNNPHVHDVVFLIEGQPFHAHKLALSASSEAFNAMFQSDCLEGKGGIPTIEIPNIKWEVFNAMMMFVYTGDTGPSTGDPELDDALLAAADQYLLEKLKRACEDNIAARLCPANVLATFELAEQYNAKSLAQRATMLVLEHYKELSKLHGAPNGYAQLVHLMRSTFEEYIPQLLQQEFSPLSTGEGDTAFARTGQMEAARLASPRQAGAGGPAGARAAPAAGPRRR